MSSCFNVLKSYKMKFVFISLLLISWLTLETSEIIIQDLEIHDFSDFFDYELEERVPVPPNITVYQQVDDREHVFVMCTYDRWIHWFSCELSVKTEQNYTLDEIHTPEDVYLFVVTVNPPVSFTCMCRTHYNKNITYLHSDTYIFNQSGNLNIQVHKDSDHHEEGVSLVYIGFVSFITLGLIIMTAAVIVTTIKSKHKGPDTTVMNNDYVDA